MMSSGATYDDPAHDLSVFLETINHGCDYKEESISRGQKSKVKVSVGTYALRKLVGRGLSASHSVCGFMLSSVWAVLKPSLWLVMTAICGVQLANSE